MAHQSLYRRYRPQRFDEVRGQDHVIGALRNAVAAGTEGHAYLFSGPRGTGKTSTARILAKALNCENLQGGEPCCDCSSCVSFEEGRSFDLFELDAASHRKVEDMRDLVSKAIVSSPGRNKVYILDEVHMLTADASATLLKTLEEPPEGVRFVLATTDPQKVLATIRSRTQHFQFQLLSADELERQVRSIVDDASLDLDDASIAWVVQKGRGSSRDTLSALDQVAAAGGVVERAEPVAELYSALVSRDTGAAILAVADSLAQGHEPRQLAEAFLDSLRDTFLVSLGVEVPALLSAERERCEAWAAELGTPALTRAMEALGGALVDMRNAADARVPLEVALVRLTAPADDSLAGLAARIDALEAAIAGGVTIAGSTSTVGDASTAAASSAPGDPTPPSGSVDPARPGGEAPERNESRSGAGPAAARAALARTRSGERAPADGPPAPPDQPAEAAAPAEASAPEQAGAPAADPRGPEPRPGARPDATPGAAAPPPQPPPPSQGGRAPGARPSSAAPAPSPPPRPPTPPRASDAPASGSEPTPTPPEGAEVSDSVSPNATQPVEPLATEPPPAEPPASDAAPSDAAPSDEPAIPATAAGHEPPASAAAADGELDPATLADALQTAVLPELKALGRAVFKDGTFGASTAAGVVFELAPGVPKEHAERSRPAVEAALAAHIGRPVTLQIVASGDAPPVSPGAAPRIAGGAVDLTEPDAANAAPLGAGTDEVDLDESVEIDLTELTDATDVAASGIERLTRAFPGAELIDEDEVST